MITVTQLAQLAQEAEMQDPIEWDYLNIDESTAYKMMATHVIEMDDNVLTLKATVVKLLVENFVTNLKLEQERGKRTIS